MMDYLITNNGGIVFAVLAMGVATIFSGIGSCLLYTSDAADD